MNEASVLAGLGASVRLVSKIGQDAAGTQVIKACQSSHIDTAFIIEDSSIDTGINIVLLTDRGERAFYYFAKRKPSETLSAGYPCRSSEKRKISLFRQHFCIPLLL